MEFASCVFCSEGPRSSGPAPRSPSSRSAVAGGTASELVVAPSLGSRSRRLRLRLEVLSLSSRLSRVPFPSPSSRPTDRPTERPASQLPGLILSAVPTDTYRVACNEYQTSHFHSVEKLQTTFRPLLAQQGDAQENAPRPNRIVRNSIFKL